MAMRKMKAMKSSMKRKAMKKSSEKGMRRMKKRVSVVARNKLAKLSVYRGTAGKVRTSGGLKKSDLIKNKHGRVVSKKASAAAKVKTAKWTTAVVKARKALGVKGFCAVGGKTQQGQKLLARARALYK